MGRRSRKRRATASVGQSGPNRAARAGETKLIGGAIPQPAAGDAAERPRSRRSPGVSPVLGRPRRREPPRPPWHPFPLSELCILVAMIMGVVGFLTWGSRGQLLVAGAMILGSAATLEFTLREHLNGFRSHSALLGGVIAVGVGVALFAVGVSRPVVIVVGAALFLGGTVAFREVFKRRSGGLAWRGGLR